MAQSHLNFLLFVTTHLSCLRSLLVGLPPHFEKHTQSLCLYLVSGHTYPSNIVCCSKLSMCY